jgi:hypothetical protein
VVEPGDSVPWSGAEPAGLRAPGLRGSRRRASRMVGRTWRIGLLSMPLLVACGSSADYDAAADAAANGAWKEETEGGADAESPSVESPCLRNSPAEAWTCNTDGMTLTRTRAGATETVHCPHGCVPLPDGFDSQCRPHDGELGSTVDGHGMTAHQASWVRDRPGTQNWLGARRRSSSSMGAVRATKQAMRAIPAKRLT